MRISTVEYIDCQDLLGRFKLDDILDDIGRIYVELPQVQMQVQIPYHPCMVHLPTFGLNLW